MPDNSRVDEPQADLATMLAAIDSRLQTLQRELEEVALPLARSAADTRRVARRATADPVVADPDDLVADVAGDAGTDASAPPPRAAVRPGDRLARAQRGSATLAPETRDEPGGARPRRSPARQAPPREEQSRADQPVVPPPVADPAGASAPARGAHGRAARSAKRRAYEGPATVAAGPFEDVEQLHEFEDALASIPTVDEVSIRTFERHHAHFELEVNAPTRLLAELESRAPQRLRLVEASERALSVEIVCDAADEAGEG